MGDKGMSQFEILKQFLNHGYFTQGTIMVMSAKFTYEKGHMVQTYSMPEVIKTRKVLVPTNANELVNMGLGEYSAKETYSLFTETPLKFQSGTNLQSNDIVVYKGVNHKILSVMDFSTHGFFKYIITKQMEAKLGD
jgi:hypothetical protein